MGSADIVPGVSGGTIAFITGIYEELLDSIRSVDGPALKLLFTGKFKKFWHRINGRFLFAVFAGILVSLFSLAKIISYFMAYYPILLWSFFFGLILISALVVSRDVQHWSLWVFIALALGAIIAFFITLATPTETPDTNFSLFISGAIAICAMILPGISGSFILLILGKYSLILEALTSLDVKILGLFAVGCLVGLMIFSRVISWLLKKFRDITIALLAGFMLGSLNKVWPWKQTLSTFTDRHGEVRPLIQENILPTTYQEMGLEPQLLGAVFFFFLGIALVVMVEKLANQVRYD